MPGWTESLNATESPPRDNPVFCLLPLSLSEYVINLDFLGTYARTRNTAATNSATRRPAIPGCNRRARQHLISGRPLAAALTGNHSGTPVNPFIS